MKLVFFSPANLSWFVAKDVCALLGYVRDTSLVVGTHCKHSKLLRPSEIDGLEISNHRDAVSRLDADERGSVVVDTLGGPQQVRTVKKDNEPWFVAKDVCDVLGIVNVSDALTRLDTDERASIVIADTSSSARKTITVSAVNKPGLFGLIFESRKPEAKAFKRCPSSDSREG